jgi:uncharacterized protein
MWEKYLEPVFQSRAPYIEQMSESEVSGRRVVKINVFSNPYKNIKIEGETIYKKLPDEIWTQGISQMIRDYDQYAIATYNPETQVKAMKQMGVDISFLYPSVGLCLFAIDTMDSQLAGALTRAYNNWLRDFCSYDTQALRGVGAINLHAPEEMVSQLHQIAEFGWKAVFLRPNPVKGRLLSDRAYEPFWRECARLGIAVALHEGTHSHLPTTGDDRFNTRFAMHACSHPMEHMMALLALIEGGVLERHPNLRVGFLEAGCGWLPYWLWRLDREYKDLGWEVKDNVKMKPSEYFRRQCFVAVEPSEPYLHDMIEYIGADNLMLGSDYPHIDHEPDIIKEAVELQQRLSKDVVKKILWDNPMRFYGLG